MRLNRFLASAGLGSRRGVEELITQGSVRVNGQVVTNLATTVLPTDSVKVGSRLVRTEQPVYAVLHKPPGYVCTAADEFDRRTIFELFPSNWPRVHHVGRLDKESEGLIFVTNDGDLTHILTHPGHEVEKEYDVLIDKPFVPDDREKLLRGFRIEGGYAKCEAVEAIKANRLRLVLKQGIKRQIRMMLYKLGYEVERLFRIRIGPIAISGLARGAWRFLTQKEVAGLQIVTHENTSVGGRPAVEIVQRLSAHGLNLQQLQTFILLNKEICIITCTATVGNFNQFLPRFRKVLDSFQVNL